MGWSTGVRANWRGQGEGCCKVGEFGRGEGCLSGGGRHFLELLSGLWSGSSNDVMSFGSSLLRYAHG